MSIIVLIVEEYNRCNKELVHQVGKKDYYCIRMHGQQNIKIQRVMLVTGAPQCVSCEII